MTSKQSVQVRESNLREKPSFLGKIIATVHYGDSLDVLKEEDAWTQVSFGSNRGWLHRSALTSVEIVVNPNANDVDRAANSDEIALAGKGFNKQVEERFKQQNKNISFTLVDKMEKDTLSEDEIQNFLKVGQLHPAGGEV